MSAAAAAAAARRCSGLRAAKTAITRGRPAVMQVCRRSMSGQIDPAVKEELRRLDDAIRDLDAKTFARIKEVATNNFTTTKRLTSLANQVLEADQKRAQQYAKDLILKADRYYNDIHVAWKVSFTMLSVCGAVGYAFIGEVKEGWQDECAKSNLKALDERVAKLKKELIAQFSTPSEEKKKPSENTTN